MYAKIFRQIYDGTLCTKGPWEALVTFQQMLVLADRNGVVDLTHDALSRVTTIPLTVIKKGIAALEKPDPHSRTPDEGGRRVVRLSKHRPWGWRIVNYTKYCAVRSQDERREYHRRYWQEKRSPKAKATPTQQPQQDSTILPSEKLNIPQQDSTASTDTTTTTDVPVDKRNNHPYTPSCGGGHDGLVFPSGLSADEAKSIEQQLNGLGDQAQVLLDELAGRMKEKSVDKPIGYLRSLIERLRAGTFTPEMAHTVADWRKWRQAKEDAEAQGDAEKVIYLLDHRPRQIQTQVAQKQVALPQYR